MLQNILLAWALSVPAPAAVPEITHQRRFRLEFAGHASHLFVEGQLPLDPEHPEMVAAFADLTRSCEVILRGPTTLELVPRGTPEVVLADTLSPAAQATMRLLDLGKLLDDPAPVPVGEAWQRIRDAFIRLREIRELAQVEKTVLRGGFLDNAAVNEHLRAASLRLFETRMSSAELIASAVWWGQTHMSTEDETLIDFEDHAVALAGRRDVKLTWLEERSPPPAHAPDLELLLASLDPLVRHERPEVAWANSAVTMYLESQLSHRYFALDPHSFNEIRRALHAAGTQLSSTWAGEEAIAAHEDNLHEHWVDGLMTALAKHPTFIAVDARHVLPGVPGRRRSLIELLRERGVTVTPMSTRPPALRLVQ